MAKSKDQYSDAETKRRFDAALRGAARVGHKPQEEMRKGKAKPKRAKRGK
jgi:hypothetical protein